MTTGRVFEVSTVEKVTISLPSELLARIEKRRQGHSTRSEVVSDLLWRGWRQAEQEDREARYRMAYQQHPETDEESEWADGAASELLSREKAARAKSAGAAKTKRAAR